jgi:hypothetical protein
LGQGPGGFVEAIVAIGFSKPGRCLGTQPGKRKKKYLEVKVKFRKKNNPNKRENN